MKSNVQVLRGLTLSVALDAAEGVRWHSAPARLCFSSQENSEFGNTFGPQVSAEIVDLGKEMQVREASLLVVGRTGTRDRLSLPWLPLFFLGPTVSSVSATPIPVPGCLPPGRGFAPRVFLPGPA